MLRLYRKSDSRSHDPASCSHAGCKSFFEAATARLGGASSAGASAKNIFTDGAGASAADAERIVPRSESRTRTIGTGAGAGGGRGRRKKPGSRGKIGYTSCGCVPAAPLYSSFEFPVSSFQKNRQALDTRDSKPETCHAEVSTAAAGECAHPCRRAGAGLVPKCTRRGDGMCGAVAHIGRVVEQRWLEPRRVGRRRATEEWAGALPHVSRPRQREL